MDKDGSECGPGGRQNTSRSVKKGTSNQFVGGKLGVEGSEGEFDVQEEIQYILIVIVGFDQSGVFGPDFGEDLEGGGVGDHMFFLMESDSKPTEGTEGTEFTILDILPLLKLLITTDTGDTEGTEGFSLGPEPIIFMFFCLDSTDS